MPKTFNLSVDSNGFAKLIFDLPGEKVNKFSEPVVVELKQVLENLKQRNDIKILTIESAKENIFIAGADIAELEKIKTPQEAEVKAKAGQEIFNLLQNLPFPTVAVIDGACLGGGLELALSCTYRIVTDNEKTSLGAPEVNLGIIPGWGGTQRLPRLIGLTQSLPMILAGKPVDGKKTFRINLADALVAKEFVQEKTAEFLKECLIPAGRKKILKRRAKVSLLTRLLERNPFGRALLFWLAKKDLLRKTKGKYPAPLKALEVVERTFRNPFVNGFAVEARAFAELAATSICKNLIQLYYTGEELKKDKGTDQEVAPLPIKSAGVLGAGVMGGGIAWLFSNREIAVRIKDINWDAIGKGFAAAMSIYKQLKKIKKLKPGQINLKMHHLSGTLDYAGFQNLDMVIEAIVEKIDVKKKVLAELESNIKKDAIICTNTSSLSVNEMASALKNPERFAGMHFFNPVNRMPLVEVIPGKNTSAQTIASVFALSKKFGKTPILVQDCPGFLVNRILLPYMGEAMKLLEEGADFVNIDKLIADFGMPMGPFTLADEVGLDICYHVMNILAAAYAPRMQTSPLLKTLFEEDKLLGKKSKKGFYLHYSKKPKPNPLIAQRLKSFSDVEIVDRCMLIMLNEAARCLEEKIVEKASYLDMALIMGTGFPPFRGGILRYAEERGIENVVNTLNKFTEKYGERFRPAQLLLDMAAKKLRFYMA